jgi:hypothetical protein
MTHQNRPSADEAKSAIDRPEMNKKPYQKPEFQCEKVFETMALACAKHPGTGRQCRARRRSS